MKRGQCLPSLLGMVAALPLWGQGAAPPLATAQAPLVLRGVTVIDVRDGQRLPDQTVVVVGNRIQALGAAKAVAVPNGARVVDAQGKYLIPGLWDMHTHTQHAVPVYSLLVASGVTGIREMSSGWPEDFDTLRAQRREIAAGTLIGPRFIATSHDFYSPICKPESLKGMFGGLGDLVAANPPADSACFRPNASVVTDPAETRRWVDTLVAGGVDFVKAHEVSDPKVYFAILAEARHLGVPAVGHLGGYDGRAATEVEASDSGIASVEHVEELECWQTGWGRSASPRPAADAEQRCAAAAERFRRNGTWFTPTLYAYYHIIGDSSDTKKHVVGLLHRFGMPMLAGSDAAAWSSAQYPAFESALHDELALLVEAGLSPLDALQAATLNPAKYLHATDSLGTVEAGKLADLVLLDADPLADIHHITRIRAVVANGYYFGRAALDGLLAEGRKASEEGP